MLLEIYIFFQLVAILLFAFSFFSKQEILWAITLVITGVMMATSYNVEIIAYEYNTTISAYQTVIITQYYPYLMGLNMIFFILAMLLGIFDLFDKYGRKFSEGINDPSTPK